MQHFYRDNKERDSCGILGSVRRMGKGDMSDLGVTRGQLLYMEWDVPLTEQPAEHVVLGINGASVEFLHNDQIVGSFSGQDPELHLLYENGKWTYRLVAAEYGWLPDGVTDYEFIVLGLQNDALVSDSGTVTVHG